MPFIGGSPYAMARDIAEGYIIVTHRTFKRMTKAELVQLKFEIERLIISVRAENDPTADPLDVQKRNRKLSRLNSCLRMIQNLLMSKRFR